MSKEKLELVRLILEESFGPAVAKVGEFFAKWKSATLRETLNADPPLQRVHESIAVLLQHNLLNQVVKIGEEEESDNNGFGVTYELDVNGIVCILMYPRYVYYGKRILGNHGEILVEEFTKRGRMTAVGAVAVSSKRLEEDKVNNFIDAFKKLAGDRYIQKVNDHADKTVGSLTPKDVLNYDENEAKSKVKEVKELWWINPEMFHQNLIYHVISGAVSRRIDEAAGKMMEFILERGSNPGAATSKSVLRCDIISAAESSSNEKLRDHCEEYMRLIEDERTRFIDKVGDEGGGVYVVNYAHLFRGLAAAVIESVVGEKFGSRALRIFRVIFERKYIEESQIQQLVMIPAKEVKLLTYQLLENNFIRLQELKKSLSGNVMAKSFNLFYVDVKLVARMVIEMCYKTIKNLQSRKEVETEVNSRLLEKQDRIESIATNMKTSGEFENEEDLQSQLEELQEMLSPAEQEQVKSVHTAIDKIVTSIPQVMETQFVLATFLYFCNLTNS